MLNRFLYTSLRTRSLSSMSSSYSAAYMISHPADALPAALEQLFAAGAQLKSAENALELRFVQPSLDLGLVRASETCLPIIRYSSTLPSPPSFDVGKYFSELRTQKTGRHVIYAPVIGSTMKVMDVLMRSTTKLDSDADSMVCIAAQQTHGQGRGSNRWISPPGCAMFTLGVRVDLNSVLGQRLGWLQHLMALSVVDWLRNERDLADVYIKWPNDVVHKAKDDVICKLGGVLVQSSMTMTQREPCVQCLIGCGVNVANAEPTLCVNSLLAAPYQRVSTEQLIAAVLSRLETFVTSFQDGGQATETLEALYCRYWLHSGQRLTVEEPNKQLVEVQGVDKHGYLRVKPIGTLKEATEADEYSLQPDGNSLDMMQGLIKVKH